MKWIIRKRILIPALVFIIIVSAVTCLWLLGVISLPTSESPSIPPMREITSPIELPTELTRQPIYRNHQVVYLDGETTLDLPPNIAPTTPRISPSGQYLTFTQGLDTKIIWLDLQTGRQRVLVQKSEAFSDAVVLDSPSFSWDEKEIIFTVNWSNHIDLAIVQIETGEIQLLGVNGIVLADPELSPDGQSVLVNCPGIDHPLGWNLCIYDRNGQYQRNLTDGTGDFYGRFTPNGQFIVYSFFDEDSELNGLYRMRVDGSGHKRLAYNGRTLAPDLVTSNDIVYLCLISHEPACVAECIINFDGSDIRRLSYLGETCYDWNE